ncbi:outer membrane protein assembly factor BamD [Leptospirillum ferrooxidans]|uniref:DNA uptake lipoprotein n=2 Tax=root TaxID=1 RepID=I0IKG9_LEPFC|nr:outer membrane protein assembly factor BamD [Leptospirillum ferrooxidans]BAM05768.1 DNA uptake lipoprotein [Leptospirillum ferrooxidans C2-3]
MSFEWMGVRSPLSNIVRSGICLLLIMAFSGCSILGLGDPKPTDSHTHAFRTKRFGTSALLDEASRFYFKGDFIEARGEYKRFLELHPTHPLAAFAQYRMALCDYYRILSIDRDPTPLRKALADFQKVIDEYPDSDYVARSQKKVAYCRDRLSRSHFYVGYFYYKTKRFKAAQNRFNTILLKYPDSTIYEKSQYYYALSSFKLKEKSRAARILKKLIRQSPNSPYAKKSRVLLDYWQREGEI